MNPPVSLTKNIRGSRAGTRWHPSPALHPVWFCQRRYGRFSTIEIPIAVRYCFNIPGKNRMYPIDIVAGINKPAREYRLPATQRRKSSPTFVSWIFIFGSFEAIAPRSDARVCFAVHIRTKRFRCMFAPDPFPVIWRHLCGCYKQAP